MAPSVVRVPSGKNKTGTPCFTSCRHFFKHSCNHRIHDEVNGSVHDKSQTNVTNFPEAKLLHKNHTTLKQHHEILISLCTWHTIFLWIKLLRKIKTNIMSLSHKTYQLALLIHALERNVASEVHWPTNEGNQEIAGLADKFEWAA